MKTDGPKKGKKKVSENRSSGFNLLSVSNATEFVNRDSLYIEACDTVLCLTSSASCGD